MFEKLDEILKETGAFVKLTNAFCYRFLDNNVFHIVDWLLLAVL